MQPVANLGRVPTGLRKGLWCAGVEEGSHGAKEREVLGAKARGLSWSSSSWQLVNSGQPMWSHECDSYSITKQEKGGRVWEYPEGAGGVDEGRCPSSLQCQLLL